MDQDTAKPPPPRIFLPDEGAPNLSTWQVGRSTHCEIPTRGVRADRELETLRERASAFVKAIPEDCAFSHGTGAQLLGIPMPRRIEGRTDLDVMRPSDRPPVVREGVRSHRGLERRQVVLQDGLAVTSPADIWCDLAGPSMRLTVDELIEAGDAVAELIAPTMLRDEAHPLLLPGDDGWEADPVLRGFVRMMATLRKRRRHKGKALLLEAFPHLRPRVWSPMETRLRLMLIRAGLPEPMLNLTVNFADGGGRMMTGDLVWPHRKVIGEYHGKMHLQLRTRSHDSDKRGLAEADGWRVIEVFSHHVNDERHRPEIIRRFAIALGLDLHAVNLWV